MGWKATFGGTRRELTEKDLTDPYSSIWEGGTVVDLDDLPPETFDEIARQESEGGNSWWGVYRYPKGEAGRMYRVVEAAAKHAGIDPPPKPSNMRDVQALMAILEPTQDIQDKPVIEGFPQTPSDPENGSSSGLSEPSDGSPQTAENSD